MTVDRVRRTPVAIVGIATIAPMAENTTRFWQNILDKVDAITEVPPSRWAISDYYDPDPTTPDRTYSKVGGFLPEIPFDPLEFGIPPNILEVIDTSQLLSLVTARRVLEDAGYLDAPSAVRDRTGVILGVGGGQTLIGPLLSRLQHPVLEQILRSVNLPQEQIDTLLDTFSQAYVPWEENAFPGLLGNVIAGRITNRLDLGGINCVVDAACASSISAIKMAVSELQEGNADMMISGGVDTDTSPFMYLSFSKTPALSKHGRSRPFDESADGMLLGEAIAMFCLKRLDDAERDGDRIYAVIRGVGASSDGRAKSIYAPSASGQVVAMRRAYEDAGISPESVDIIEAHGTGTARGDATELESVATLLNDYGVGPKQVAVGSVKSQVGHTKAAAGGVSLAKMALALHHKILPPTINVENPNPALHEPGNPLYVNTEARPWIRRHHPRRAGLSSFGFGGTNFHMVLEEYTSASSETPAFRHRLHTTPRIVILHAKNPSELAGMIEHHLTAETTLAALVALYDATPIPADHARLGFVAVDDDEAIEKLQKALDQLRTNTDHVNWKPGQGIFYRQMATTGKLVALFPGQGSQYVNMGRDLLNQFPHLQHIMERFDDAYPDGRLSEIVYPPPSFDNDSARTQSSQLMQTENAQPALGAMSMMLYALLRDAGFQPDMTAGHSFGELTALWAADALTDDDFIQLAIARGQAMKAHPGMDSGQMAAVIGDVAMLETHLQGAEGVHIANHNSQRQAVIAGARDKLAAATPQLEQTGYRVIPLSVSAAFHTPLVQHAQAAFAAALENVTLHPPRTDVYANSTAGLYPHAEDAIQQLLTEHILKSVRFREQIEAIYEDGGRIFVEIGPRNVLTRLLKDILPHGTYDVIAPDVDSKQGGNQHLHEAVAKLMVLGVNLQNFDRYAPTTNDIASEPSPLNVMLSGSNYVSARTQNAYETQLNQNRTMAFTSVDANVPETNMEENQPVMPSDTPPSRGKTIDAHHL
ncbi:MAG: beta-ketoacyl synthase N-terminal-like domain-containing protein, partial [Chloroflexota bacterium]